MVICCDFACSKRFFKDPESFYPMDPTALKLNTIDTKTKRNIIFLCIVYATVHLFLILFLNPSVKGDDAVMGIMGLHASEFRLASLFYYGQPYNAAAGMFALLSAPFHLLITDASIAYLFSNLLISIGIFLLALRLSFLYFGRKVMNITAIFFIFSAGYTLLFRLLFADYLVSTFLNLLIVSLFLKFYYTKKKVFLALCGVVSGISHAALEFSLVFTLTCLALWFLRDKLFFLRKQILYFIVPYALSSLPLILYNIAHRFENIKMLLAGSFIHRFACSQGLIPSEVLFQENIVNPCSIFDQGGTFGSSSFFQSTIPSFLGEGYFGIVLFMLSAFLLLVAIVQHHRLLREFTPVFFTTLRSKMSIPPSFAVLFCVFCFFFFYLLSGFTDPKHLLPVVPFLFISLAVSVARVRIPHFKQLTILAFVILSLFSTYSLSLADPDFKEAINVMEERYITHVYSGYTLKWALVLNTKEHIVASCEGFAICGSSGRDSRYSAYEQGVEESGQFFYLFDKESSSTECMRSTPGVFPLFENGRYVLLEGSRETFNGLTTCEALA